MEITCPEGLVVEAHFNGFYIRTDQPEKAGGTATAPSPFDLFLASLGTCAGFFALRFCRERNLDATGLSIFMEKEKGEIKKLDRVRFRIRLPKGFPDKYHKAIIRAVDQCAVKQVLADPPEFETIIEKEEI